MTTKEEERQHFQNIQQKIKETTGVSLIKLAREAFNHKSEELGMLFLEQEKSVVAKIPQYVELKKWDKALELGLQTYDKEIINTIINKMIKLNSIDDFIGITGYYKLAHSSIISFLRENDPEILELFLKSNNLQDELFTYYIQEFFKSGIVRERTHNLSQAKLLVQEVLKKQPLNEDWKFNSTYLSDLENQMVLKSDLLKEGFIKSDISNFDQPIFSIMNEAISNEKYTYIESKNKQLFDLSIKKLSILRVKSYADNKITEALRLFNQNMKTTVQNYIAYADCCYNNNLYEEAVLFLKKINTGEELEYKVFLLIEMNKLLEALDVAIGNKNIERKGYYVNLILTKDSSYHSKVDELCDKYKVEL